MNTIEKKILKTACDNLRRATAIPRSFERVTDYEEWIRTASRAAIDLVNIANTLMDDDEENDSLKTTPIKL